MTVVDSQVVDSQARELTSEELEARGQLCKALNDEIKTAIARGRLALWDLGKALYEFHEQNGWTALGYGSQNEWLADPEISMTKSMFMRITRRYRELVIFRHIPVTRDELPAGQEDDPAAVVLAELDASKLDIVMPTIESGKIPLDEILSNVRELGARDLAEEYLKTPAPPRDPDPSSEPGENGDARTEEEVQAAKDQAALIQATTVIDSWLELGGDRRKPRRQLAKVTELHPFFAAWAELQACIEGKDGAPERSEVAGAWKRVMRALKLTVAEG